MPPLRGLYAITDSNLIPRRHLAEAVALAIRGGATMVQYRDKGDDPYRRALEARDLSILCRSLGVPLIVNDDVELAHAVDAAGVHLGRDDADLSEARATLGPQAIIGVSCYNDLQRADTAAAAGADYVAFGSFFPSGIKPNAVPADPNLLREAKQRLSIPVVAIGGITAENGATLVEAGADLLAVISAVFDSANIEQAAHALAALYEQ